MTLIHDLRVTLGILSPACFGPARRLRVSGAYKTHISRTQSPTPKMRPFTDNTNDAIKCKVL